VTKLEDVEVIVEELEEVLLVVDAGLKAM